MTTPIEEIRAAIEAANDLNGGGPHEGIAPFLADEVETVHEPRFPNDRVVEGTMLVKLGPVEHEMMDAAIENRHFDVTVKVRGDDEIVMQGLMTGRLRHDGSEFVHPVHIVWTVKDGRIVRFWVDASTPEIMEGYRRQGEAFTSPAVRPHYEKLLAVMGIDPASSESPSSST
jgi:ketosteroid isomerase-like protein